MRFEGRSYLILGASGGIGSETARRLAARGARLALCGRTADKLDPLAQPLGAAAYAFDATNSAEVDRAVADAAACFGRLDGVVNCVGSILLKPAHLTTDEEWNTTLSLNLGTAFSAVRAGARAMMAAGGSIVLVSSAAARMGLVNHEAIAAAKAGVIGLTLSAAASYAPRGIRVNCVAPGLVATAMSARITSSEPALKASTAMHALGRIGKPEDVASAILWLLDPESTWVTGQVVGVDGGLGSVRPR
jgi:NAD(P)-dependent dehydrogenase (short-subunit alcohol dehydrogenase family)